MVLSFNKFISVLLFLMCLFPYVSIINTPFDTQPYAIAFAFIILMLIFVFKKDINIPKLLIPFGIVFAYSLIMMWFSPNVFTGLRSDVGYASVLFLSLAGYFTFKYVQGKHFIFAVIVWLVFGSIQTLINKEFGSFLISSLRTSDSRGVTSLAVEPSYYSVICIFFFILNDVFFARGNYSKKVYRTLFLLITLQIFLAKAGLGIALFFIYLISLMISQRNFLKVIRWFIGISIIAAIFLYLFSTVPSLQLTRLGGLVLQLQNDPLNIFLQDASVSDRMVHAIVSMLSLPFSYGLGFGLGTWGQHAPDIVSNLGGFVKAMANLNVGYGTIIMSGWGTAIFELGLAGVLLLFSFFYLMRKGFKRADRDMKRVYISSTITIFFTMIMAVPLSFPLFGYVIGVFVYLQFNKNNKISAA